MFLAHAAPAFLVKPLLANTSLGALLIATFLADIVGFLLGASGIEVFRYNKAKVGSLPYDFIMPYTHSLAGMCLLGLVYTAAYLYALRQEPFSGASMKRFVMIMALVASHWILEVPVHRTWLDGVTVWLRDTKKYGWGYFDYQLTTLAMELAILLPSIAFYAAFTRPKPGINTNLLKWYERLDVFTAVTVLIQFFVLAAPRFVYEKTPDALMALNSVTIYAAYSWMAHQIDMTRDVSSQPQIPKKVL